MCGRDGVGVAARVLDLILSHHSGFSVACECHEEDINDVDDEVVWLMAWGLAPESSTWFGIYGLWFVVYGLWFMVYGSWFMVYGLWMMGGLRFGF